MALLDPEVAAGFGVPRRARRMFGSERRTYLSGGRVLRKFHVTRPASQESLTWRLEVLRNLRGPGFRTERPLPARDGRWSIDGWTAWTFVEGRPATKADAPAVLDAVEALHAALSGVPRHPAMATSPADRRSWEDEPLPGDLPPVLAEPLERLAALRRPLPGLRPQLIHGDMHYTNILVAPEGSGEPPAFIDWALYWRPPEFASAIAAYWLGPNLGDLEVLRHFARVPHLEQLLVRVAMRQLLFFVEHGPLRESALPDLKTFVRSADLVAELFK